MKAGRELDALIAEKIMGRPEHGPGMETCPKCGIQIGDILGQLSLSPHRVAFAYICPAGHESLRLNPYSTDIAAAWEVLCKMGEIGFGHEISGSYGELNRVEFSNGETSEHVFADGLPLAICLAALKAIE